MLPYSNNIRKIYAACINYGEIKMDKVIAETDLIPFSYYLGEGRVGHVAYWDGEKFIAISPSCGYWGADFMAYGSAGFDPFKSLIDKCKRCPLITMKKASGRKKFSPYCSKAEKYLNSDNRMPAWCPIVKEGK